MTDEEWKAAISAEKDLWQSLRDGAYSSWVAAVGAGMTEDGKAALHVYLRGKDGMKHAKLPETFKGLSVIRKRLGRVCAN